MIGWWWKIEGKLLGDNELEKRDRGVKGSVSAYLLVNIDFLVCCHPFLDEKVRRIDQSCRLTSQSREESQRDWIMSGRPRTTSFAESCKPVPQPSAFGSMKVSSKYPTVNSLVTYPIFFTCSRDHLWTRCPHTTVSPHSVLKMCEASMTLAGSLALSYLCQWLRLAPAERHAGRGGAGGVGEHTPLHCAPPWSAWRGLAGRVGAGPGRRR